MSNNDTDDGTSLSSSSDGDDGLPRLVDRTLRTLFEAPGRNTNANNGGGLIYEAWSDDDDEDSASSASDDDEEDYMSHDPRLKCPICSVIHEKDVPYASSYQKCSHGAILIYIPSDCPVCLREKVDPPNVALQCGHVYCIEDFKLMGGCVGIGLGGEKEVGASAAAAAAAAAAPTTTTTERTTFEEGAVDDDSIPVPVERIRGNDSEEDGDRSEGGEDLRPGSLMMLDGLRSIPSSRLNGEVVSIIEQSGFGRYIVRLISTGAMHSINATNLVPRLPDPDGDDDNDINDSVLPGHYFDVPTLLALFDRRGLQRVGDEGLEESDADADIVPSFGRIADFDTRRLTDVGGRDGDRSSDEDDSSTGDAIENLILRRLKIRSAMLIQSFWRKRIARGDVRQRLEVRAVTAIQSAWRGRMGRQKLQVQRILQARAIMPLQSVWRRRIAREGFRVQRKLMDVSSRRIQTVWRGFAVRLAIRKNVAAIKTKQFPEDASQGFNAKRNS